MQPVQNLPEVVSDSTVKVTGSFTLTSILYKYEPVVLVTLRFTNFNFGAEKSTHAVVVLESIVFNPSETEK